MRTVLRFLSVILGFLCIVFLIIGVVYFKKDIPVEKLIEKYANADSKFMVLMGLNVHYKDEGDATDSNPLVLIHGTSSSLLTWDSSVSILKKQHRIIRLDLPGYGITGPNPEREYGFDYYNTFLDSFLNRLQVKHCALAGNSLGGSIVWNYTLVYPEKVSKLILVDAGGFTSSTKPNGALGFKLAQMPVMNQLLKVITPKFLVKKSLEDVYGDKTKVTNALVDQYYDMLLRTGNRQAIIDRMQKGFGSDASDKIKEIKTPTLIIWGDKDQLIPIDCAYLFKKNIVNSQLEILKSVGHVPMEESPEKFSYLVNRFLMIK